MELPFSGDNRQLVDTDFQMSDYGELTEMLKKMPKLDTTIIHYSQYNNVMYMTGCTIMSGINAVATILNYNFTQDEISSVYDLAEQMGRKPGSGRARGAGWNVVRKRWNAKFPDNQMLMFVSEIFSDDFHIIMEKLGIVGVSISVDGVYRKDARDNLTINGTAFLKQSGHATTMQEQNLYQCVDSVPQKAGGEPMIYTWGNEDKIRELMKSTNIRKDCHVIVMANWLKADPAEKERLMSMKINLEEAILCNSRLWALTNSPEEKQKRNEMNNYNRGKLAIVIAMIGKL